MAAEKGNKYAIGNNGGRPPIYDNPEELEAKVLDYFAWCQGEYEERTGERKTITGKGDDKKETIETYTYEHCLRNPETPSVTGFALHLGFNSKSTLYEYAEKEEFSNSIKRGLLMIENAYEGGLWNDRPTGAIFALKNMGWKDKKEIEASVSTNQINLGDGEKPEEE